MKYDVFEFNIFGENTYIIWDDVSREAAVVDPGMASQRDCDEVDAFISANNLRITHLLFTHLHIDHTFGAEHIMARYGVGVEAHMADAPLGLARADQAAMFRLPVDPPALEIVRELKDGDKITFGDDSLEILHVPGHSPGSVAYYNRTGGWVLTGDVLFRGSVGRTDLAGGHHGQLIRSINGKLLVLPDSTVVLPGHGPATTVGRERASNPYIF